VGEERGGEGGGVGETVDVDVCFAGYVGREDFKNIRVCFTRVDLLIGF